MTRLKLSPELKAKAAHEGREFLVLFLYLSFFFCALVLYNTLLLREYHIEYWNSSLALVNARVVAKVILIGDALHVGRRYEDKPLFVSAIVKSLLFGLLVFAFRVLEEWIKRMVHGVDVASASRDVHIDQLLAGSLVIFCTFIPLFGFRELRRLLGEEEFRSLVFHSKAKSQAAARASD